ncbi:MAG: DNA helicase RecQ [Mangrovibacterium sp.]
MWDKKTLTAQLEKHFGFSVFKGQQEEVITSILNGQDTFVLMPTGGGKSLCYQLPALMMEGTAIVVSPLIALMKNQVDSIRNTGADDSVAHFLNSSLNKQAINQVKEDVLSGKTKLLYVAPESLTKEENIEFLRQAKISFYAIDEAHCISEWGHDFRPEYRRIRPIVEEVGKAPIIALTATATAKVQHDIQKSLDMLHAKVFKASFNRPNLYYEVRAKIKPENQIIKYIKNNEGKSGIIYCLSRKRVEELTELLTVNGISAIPYHAGLDAATRNANQDKFLMEDVNVVVATIAFGMGIDKPDVRFVMHYDIPKSLEGYYQETGRAGRDGGEGECITYYSYKDIQKLEKFMHGRPVAEQEIGHQLLFDTASFAESAICRRIVLLNYFGEELSEPCGNCDNCLNPKEEIEASEDIVKMLRAVAEVKSKYKAEHITDILTGKSTAAIKSFKHDTLKSFGIGSMHDHHYWNAVFRQAILARFILKDIENYGILRLTKKGEEFIEKPTKFMLVRNHDYKGEEAEAEDKQSIQTNSEAGDPVLFNLLKDLRKKTSKKHNLPPYVIFQDPSLADMSIQYPITIEELTKIQGVGEGKAKKFGQEFVQLIKEYVDENEIERAQDLVVRQVANKSKNKVAIIQMIDRKTSIEDIANSLGLELTDVLTEIEAIVNSGTRVNITYCVNDLIDEELQAYIFDFFRESDNGSIDAALAEFSDDDLTEEDIRLMRIKFISDLGN